MSDQINDGGPAYPIQASEYGGHGTYHGMTLRDYFAAKAIHGILAGNHPICQYEDAEGAIASVAYRFADAMLRTREMKQ